jgi:hypothetical protein
MNPAGHTLPRRSVTWEVMALALGHSASDTIWLRDYVRSALSAHPQRFLSVP